MADRRVVYRAIAEFAALRRSVKGARSDLKALKKDADEASVSLGDDFGAKLKQSLKAARQQIRRSTAASTEKLKVEAEVEPILNEGAFKDALAKAARTKASTEIPVTADTSGFNEEIDLAVQSAESQTVDIEVDPVFSDSALELEDQDLQVEAEIKPVVNEAEFKRAMADVAKRRATIEVLVEAGTTGLRGEVTRAVEVAEAGQEINVPVVAETDTDGPSKFTRALSTLGDRLDRASSKGGVLKQVLLSIKWPALFFGASLLASALSTLAAAAAALVTSMGPLVGIFGALPGLMVGVAGAAGAVIAAFSGVGDALKAAIAVEEEQRIVLGDLTTAEQNYQQALANLGPVGATFVQTLLGMRRELNQLKGTAQAAVLPGLTIALQNITKLAPTANELLARLGRTIADQARLTSRTLISPEVQKDLQALGTQGQVLIRGFGAGVQGLIKAFLNLGVAAKPVVDFIAQLSRQLGAYLENATAAGRESGKLTAFFERSVEVTKQWGRIIRDLAVGLFNFFKGGSDLADDFRGRMEDGAAEFRAWTESVEGENSLKKFFDDARPAVDALLRLIGGIGRVFGELSTNNGLAPLLDQITNDLLPVIQEGLAGVSEDFGPALIEFIVELSRAFSVLAGTSGPLTIYVQVLGTLLQMLNFLLNDLGPLSSLIKVFVFSLLTLSAAAKTIQLLGVINALGGFSGAFKLATAVVGLFTTTLTAAGAANLGFAATFRVLLVAIGPVGWAITALTVAVGALSLGFFGNSDAAKKDREEIDRLAQSFTDLNAPLKETVDLLNGAVGEHLQAALNDLNIDATEFASALRGTDEEFAAFLQRMQDAGRLSDQDALRLIAERNKQLEIAIEAVNDAEFAGNITHREATRLLDGLNDGTVTVEQAQLELADAAAEAAGAMDSEGNKAEGLIAKLRRLKDELQAVEDNNQIKLDITIGGFSADLQAEEAAQQAEEAISDYRDAALEANEDVANATDRVVDANKNVIDAIEAVGDAEERVIDAQLRVRDAQQAVNDAREEAADRVRELRREIQSLTATEAGLTVDLARARQEALARRADSASVLDIAEADADVLSVEARLAEVRADKADATQELAERERVGIENSKEVLAAQRDLVKAYKDVADAQKGVADANERVAEAQQDAAEAQLELVEAKKDSGDATERLEAAERRAAGAALAMAAAHVAEQAAIHEANDETYTAEQQTEDYKRKLEELAGTLAPGDPLRQRLEGYIGQLEKTKGTFESKVKLTMDTKQAAAELAAFLRIWAVTLSVLATIGQANKSEAKDGGGWFPGLAHGGKLKPGVPTAVGEDGFEIAYQPYSGGPVQFFSNAQSRQMAGLFPTVESTSNTGQRVPQLATAGGAGATSSKTIGQINFNGLPEDPRQVAEKIAWEMDH